MTCVSPSPLLVCDRPHSGIGCVRCKPREANMLARATRDTASRVTRRHTRIWSSTFLSGFQTNCTDPTRPFVFATALFVTLRTRD